MTKEDVVECAIKLLGLYDIVFNATGSALQILANGLELKYASFSKAYYFMFLLSEVMIGWALLVYSKRITKWVFSFDQDGNPSVPRDEEKP